MEYKPTKAQEAIRDWLREQGIASRYSPKKWKIKIDTPARTVFVYTMRDAIEYAISCKQV